MQLSRILSICVVAFASTFGPGPAGAEPDLPSERDADDLLGPLVVEATPQSMPKRRLLRVAVEPSLDASPVDVLLHAVVERDLELSGEFQLLQGEGLPGFVAHDRPPDLDAWRRAGVEALVRLHGSQSAGDAAFSLEVFLTNAAPETSFRRALRAPLREQRLGAHRVADAAIGALTGRPGGFASRITFLETTGSARRAFIIDADGHERRLVSGRHDLVSATAFGPGEGSFFAASVARGRYRLYAEIVERPFEFLPAGSIYGVAWDAERTRLAMAVAVETSVRIFWGSSRSRELTLASRTDLALDPTFSPSGQLAYVGIERGRSRIYVDGRPVSPRGLWASAPTFCDHPDGARLVYSVGFRNRTELVSSDPRGGLFRRLTRGPGSNGPAACSPDGRLLAFFSTRRTHEGPGLYVMPLAGGTPRRISSALGSAPEWSNVLPESVPDE